MTKTAKPAAPEALPGVEMLSLTTLWLRSGDMIGPGQPFTCSEPEAQDLVIAGRAKPAAPATEAEGA
jgi:hypothetical protein